MFLVRLPHNFNAYADECAGLLFGLQTKRNYLWLVRPKKIDASLECLRQGQTFARLLPEYTHTNVRAMLRLLAKKDRYQGHEWLQGEAVICEEIKVTYLGELLFQVRDALAWLQGVDESGQAAKEPAGPAVDLPREANQP